MSAIEEAAGKLPAEEIQLLLEWREALRAQREAGYRLERARREHQAATERVERAWVATRGWAEG